MASSAESSGAWIPFEDDVEDLDTELTRLLHDWSSGDPQALERLVPLVYDDLRRLAESSFGRENPGHTLQATAIVHELYVKLIDQQRIHWRNRGQFFAVAAIMMRRILVSHARKVRAKKRGGEAVLLSLDEALHIPGGQSPDVVALDLALKALAAFAPRQSQIIELRFFGGLTIPETAAILGTSPSTIKKDWKLARAWLFREMSQS